MPLILTLLQNLLSKTIRLKTPKTRYVIFETKGYVYEGTEEKRSAAERWCRAVNHDGRFGEWQYKMSNLDKVRSSLDEIQQAIRD